MSTDHFSGPDNADDLLYVCVCILDIWHGGSYKFSLKVKVIDEITVIGGKIRGRKKQFRWYDGGRDCTINELEYKRC